MFVTSNHALGRGFLFGSFAESFPIMQLVFPTAYFPPVSWAALFLSSEAPVLEIHETFPKQTLRNRCNIMAANGKLRLSVPIKKPSGNQSKTREILIDNHTLWPRMHFRSLASAYRKTPFFFHYEEMISDLLFSEHKSLVELNSRSINLIINILRLEKEWTYTETFERAESSMARIKDFEGAIANSGIQLSHYHQTFSERFGFMPDLSVLDLIFNLGPVASKQYLMNLGDQLIQHLSAIQGRQSAHDRC